MLNEQYFPTIESISQIKYMLKSSDLPTKINHLKIQQIPNKTQEKAFNKSNPINMYVQKTYTNLINSIPNIL